MWLSLFKNVELTFEKGSVLTREMLEELKAFPKDILDIWYNQYPDGILAGTELAQEEDESGNKEIYIRKGLLKYKGCIYRMEEDLNLTRCIRQWSSQGKIQEQSPYKLVFVPDERILPEGRTTRILHSMKLTACPKSMETEGILYARFKILESETVSLFHQIDVEDISRATYWNMTECPYSCLGGSTYHPYIFEIIRRKLMAKKRKSQLDYLVLNEITRSQTINMEFILMILADKQRKADSSDRTYVLRHFITVLMTETESACVGEVTTREELKREEYGRLLT